MRNIKHEKLIINPVLILGLLCISIVLYTQNFDSIMSSLFVLLIILILTIFICSLFHNCFVILDEQIVVYKSFLGIQISKRKLKKSTIESISSCGNNGFWMSLGYKWIDVRLNNGKNHKFICWFYPYETIEDVVSPESANYTFDDLHSELYQKNYEINWYS